MSEKPVILARDQGRIDPMRPGIAACSPLGLCPAFLLRVAHRDHAADAPMPTLKLNADRADLDLIAVVLGSE
jgi:hypothetical protein